MTAERPATCARPVGIVERTIGRRTMVGRITIAVTAAEGPVRVTLPGMFA